MKQTAAALASIALVTMMLAWRLPGTYRALPLLQPDSTSYIQWEVTRPPVYPISLRAVRGLSPDFALLGPLQLSLFIACSTWLSLTLSGVTERPWLGIALGAGVMLHPQVLSYAFTILPESLLASLLMAHVASTMHLFAHRSTPWALASGLTLAAAILTKPAAVAFISGTIIVAATLRRPPRRARVLAVWVAAIVLPYIAASAVNRVRSGPFSPQAIGGYALLGVTGTFVPDDTPIEPLILKTSLLDQVRPVRDELMRIDSLEMYYFYSSNAYHAVSDRSREVILDHLRHQNPRAPAEDLFLRMNAVAATIARVTIQHAPREYMRHVMAHLYGLWLMPLVQNANDQQNLEERLQRVRQQAPLLAEEPVRFRFVHGVAYWPFKMLLGFALLCSVGIVVGWLKNPESLQRTSGAYAAILLHAYFLLTAMAQTGLPRYALTAWPLTMFVLLLGVAAGLPRSRGTARWV